MTDEMQAKAALLQKQLAAALPEWNVNVAPDWLLPDDDDEYPLTPVFTVIVERGGKGKEITLTRDFVDGAQGDPVALVVDMVKQGA